MAVNAPRQQANGPQRLSQALGPIIRTKIAEGSFRLPTPPASAMRIAELLRRDELDPRGIVRALERDPVLAAELVRAANAIAFRGRQGVSSIRDAVVRLGARQLRSFLVTAIAFQLFTSKDRALQDHMQTLRAHSVAVSLLARDIAQLVRCEEVEEAYLAGLLHDIGKVVVLTFVLEVTRVHGAGQRGITLRSEDCAPALRDLHRDVGARMLAELQLPASLQEMVAASAEYRVELRASPGNMVCLANAITKRLRIYLGDARADEVTAAILIGQSLLGVDEEVIERLCAGLEERVRDV